MSTPYKVVDISDPANIKDFLEEEKRLERTDSVDDYAVTEAESEPDDDDDLGFVPRLLFSTFSTLTLLVPLTSVHVAMDILVHQQYVQEVDAVEIAARAGTAALVLSFLLGAVHPRKEAPILRIAMFGAFLALGVAMIHVSRDGSFYAVMKQAPGIGTLLIFCAIELPIAESMAALVLVAAYAFWHGNGKLFD